MDVIAFVGPPGTGKSDRAIAVAHKNKAECIIDDGILIYDNRIVAGKSAKKEESRLKAVRRAIFLDENQVEDVKKSLAKINPARILILGTSERMIIKITEQLNLQKPFKYIHIEDVARPEEIKKANEARYKEGKHVIPVPTVELKPYFRGYLVYPLRFFRNRNKSNSPRVKNEERSVVRPVFSYYGKLSFSDRVIEKLVKYSVQDIPYLVINKVDSKKSREQINGLVLRLEIEMHKKNPDEMKKIVHKMRDNIQKEIEYTTGMSIETVKLNIITNVSKA